MAVIFLHLNSSRVVVTRVSISALLFLHEQVDVKYSVLLVDKTMTLLCHIFMSDKTQLNKRFPQLRIAVNARCGRACIYCRPSGEAIATAPWLTLNELHVLDVVEAFAKVGGEEIKITGGDPALWPPLVSAVSNICAIPGIQSVEVVSRNPRIGELAPDLAKAGVSILNMSIDSLNPAKHKFITGIDDLGAVVEALNRCVATGVKCKVNTVVLRDINESEILPMADFFAASGVSTFKLLDIIRDLDSGEESFSRRLSRYGKSLRDLYVPVNKYVDEFQAHAADISTGFQGQLGHPMSVLKLKNGLTVVVKDHARGAWYGSICSTCSHYPCHDALMALRLTADGRFQPCLLNTTAAVKVDFEDKTSLTDALNEMIAIYDIAQFNITASTE
jgi:cyclic pyranopterin phosphate synthase